MTNITHGSTISDSGTEKQPENRTGIMGNNMATSTTKIENVNNGNDNGKTHPMMSITESISSDGKNSEVEQDSRTTETSISDTEVSLTGDGKPKTSTQPMSGTDSYYSVSPGTATNTDSEATNETTDHDLITNSTNISNTTTTDLGLITTTTDSTTDNETTNNTDTVSVPESVPELTTVTSDTTIAIGSTESGTIDPDLTSNESTIATTLFNNTTAIDTNATMTETDVVTTGIDNATIGPELTTYPELFDNSTTKLINSTTTDPESNILTRQVNNTTVSVVTTTKPTDRNPTTSTLSMSTAIDLEQSKTTVTESTAVTTAVHVTVPESVDIAESTGFTTTESMDKSTTVTVSGLDTNMTTKSGFQIILYLLADIIIKLLIFQQLGVILQRTFLHLNLY